MQRPSPEILSHQLASLPGARPILDAVAGLEGVYVVGGVPRDLLLGRMPKDFDLVVEGEALRVAGAIAARIGASVRMHERFETATVSNEETRFDIASARTERYAAPGALPEVHPATLAQDLGRRDVTVNAIAIALGGQDKGAITATPGALDDLDAGLLRILHPGSFVDDPTRLLRVARYGARLGFAIEAGTRRSAAGAVADGALATVSGTRLGRELRLALDEPDPDAALAAFEALALLGKMIPGARARPEIAATARSLLPADGDGGLTTLAASLATVGKDVIEANLGRLGFTNEAVAVCSDGAAAQALVAPLLAATRPSEIARVVRESPVEAVALAGALGAARPAQQWTEHLRDVRTEISGEDVLRAGVARGPAVGIALAAALEARLDGLTRDARDELAAAVAAVDGR